MCAVDRDVDPEALAYRRQVGQRLRAARESKTLSLRDVGARLGISHGTVGHWETGQNPIDLDALRRLARLYETSVVALLAERMTDEDVIALALRQLADARQATAPSGPRGKRDGTRG